MTRLECEKKLFELGKQIDAVVKEYDPKNTYWSMAVTDTVYLTFNNDYFEKDVEKKIRNHSEITEEFIDKWCVDVNEYED